VVTVLQHQAAEAVLAVVNLTQAMEAQELSS
jgi:hypothetical protein